MARSSEEQGSETRGSHGWLPRGEGDLLLVDVRRFTPDLIRPLVTAIVDELVTLGATDGLMIVSGYECTGIAYQLDMRRETRGLYHYECVQRSDGAWVETIRRI